MIGGTRARLTGCVLILFAVGAGAARADVQRSGFTLELGVGVGAIQVDGLPDRDSALLDVALEPHSISLGGFLSERLALLYRWSSAYYFARNAAGETAQGVLGTHGVQLQAHFGQRWFIAGGPAVAFFGNVLGRHAADPAISIGGGGELRAGWAFAAFTHHALRLTIKIVLGIFPDRTVAGQTMNLEYQWH